MTAWWWVVVAACMSPTASSSLTISATCPGPPPPAPARDGDICTTSRECQAACCVCQHQTLFGDAETSFYVVQACDGEACDSALACQLDCTDAGTLLDTTCPCS